MVKILRWILKVVLAGIISLIVMSIITVVYSHTGVHVSNPTGATDYKWESCQFRSNMAEGFSWLWLNGDGFNNSFDFADMSGTDILLMGSSHMEAVNVPKDKNVGYLLNENLPEWTTYNIGISGHTIYQCVNNLSAAISYYQPRSYVVIETDRVKLDEEQMMEVLEHSLAKITSHESGFLYAVQKYIPCFLPLYRELKNWMSLSVLVKAGTTDNQLEILVEEEYTTVLDDFIKRIADTVDDRRAIIFYHPNTIIDEDGSFLEDDRDFAKVFAEVCRRNNITFVNMYDDFKKLYDDSHKLGHGFVNTAVGAGHLNVEGHRVIALRLTEAIKAQENGIE